MDLPVFVFGTLRDDRLRAAVAGRALPGAPASLPDHAAARAQDRQGRAQPFPLLTPRAGARAEGLLLRPGPVERARLDVYERLFRYHPHPVTALYGDNPVPALVYLPEDDCWNPGEDWRLDLWAAEWAALRAGAAAEVMALWPDLDPDAMARRYPMIEAAIAARLRAQGTAAPASLRRSPGPGDVVSHATRRPYAGFFGVREDDVRFRRFDGTPSPPVTRAGFVMGDAVSVLPWDPKRDLVLVIEQFRYGAWLRGDRNPWSLEPVAGRIDAGETPEAAARRETTEEARLALDRLEPVASYYPSPAAVTEYLISFIGLADLGPANEGIGGLETEAEDIRAHVIPFDRLLALIAAGEVANAPLLISALWLAPRRADLRAGAAPAA